MFLKNNKYYDWEGNEIPNPQELCTDTAEINKRREIDSRDPLVQKTAKLMKDVGKQVRAKKVSR
jgi:hypothetical protein